MTAPHVVYMCISRVPYMKSGMAAPNYSIYGIILNQECGTAPINNCGLIIHDTVCILVKYTVKPRYNAGRGRKNFEAKNRVIARSAL